MARASSKPEPMSDSELESVIGQQISHARSYLSAEVASDRQENLRYYLNRPLGNEVEGRSQVISTDVQDTVESIMPDLVEMFAASGAIWKYQPASPEDVPLIKQIDSYIFDIVWGVDNEGFMITHDALKDVLLEKTGILKIWWDDDRPTTVEMLREVPLIHLAQYEADPNVEIIEAEPNMRGEVPTGLYDVKIERTQETGRCRIEVVPSEEFLVNARTRELDETCTFCAHRRYTSRSELVEQGYSKEFVWDLPTIEGNNNANLDRSRIRHARYSDDRSALTDYGVQFDDQREVEVYECYVLMDYDGDGIAKRYLVRVAGSDGQNLLPDPDTGESAVEVAEHPFVKMEAIRQTHRFFGRAVADLVRDIQKIKSTLQRETLNSVYQMNNQRSAVSDKVDLDDYLANEIGGAVQVNDSTAMGHIVPLPAQPVGQFMEPLLRYWDEVGQNRTGIAGGAEPLDPKAFHETFGGANLMLGQMMKRLLFYARVIAETGFKAAGKKILRTVVNNQDAARVVRLNNSWVPVDPRRWNAALDVKVVAGLGHGTKESRVAGAMQLGAMQEKIIATLQRGSLAGPFVTPEHISNTLETVCDGMSLDRSLYFGDLDEQSMRMLMQPPPPEPSELEKLAEMQKQVEQGKAQLQIMKEKADNQIDLLKIREDARQADQDAQLKLIEYQAKYSLEEQKLLLTAQQAQQAQESTGNGVNVTYQAGDDVAEALMGQSGAIGDSMALLAETVAALKQSADTLSRPRRLVRDEAGRPVASEIVPE